MTKASVKEYQQKLSILAGKHQRALLQLEAAKSRREKLLCIQNELVENVEQEVRQSVAEMAKGVGPELTANVIGLDLIEVRRIMKSDN